MAATNIIPVGSRLWEQWVDTFQKFAALTERRAMLREDERAADPDNPDLRNQSAMLWREVSFAYKRAEHFEKTGEVLPHPTEAGDYDERPLKATHLCPVCKATDTSSGRFVRVDVQVGSKHFGKAIPCPACNKGEYEAYVTKYGVPPGMPEPKNGGH